MRPCPFCGPIHPRLKRFETSGDPWKHTEPARQYGTAQSSYYERASLGTVFQEPDSPKSPWERRNDLLEGKRYGGMQSHSSKAGCPTLAAFLFLRLGWDATVLVEGRFNRQPQASPSARCIPLFRGQAADAPGIDSASCGGHAEADAGLRAERAQLCFERYQFALPACGDGHMNRHVRAGVLCKGEDQRS